MPASVIVAMIFALTGSVLVVLVLTEWRLFRLRRQHQELASQRTSSNEFFSEHRLRQMPAVDIIDTLSNAGFTTEQALGVTGVIFAIQAGAISRGEVGHHLEKNGFDNQTAEQLTKVFFNSLAVAT